MDTAKQLENILQFTQNQFNGLVLFVDQHFTVSKSFGAIRNSYHLENAVVGNSIQQFLPAPLFDAFKDQLATLNSTKTLILTHPNSTQQTCSGRQLPLSWKYKLQVQLCTTDQCRYILSLIPDKTIPEHLAHDTEQLIASNNMLDDQLQKVSYQYGELEKMVINSGIASIFIDKNLHLQNATPAAKALLQLSPQNCELAKQIMQFFGEETSIKTISLIQEVIDQQKPQQLEVERKDQYWYLLQIAPYKNLQNQIGGVTLTFLDIHNQKKEALLFQTLADHTPVGIFMNDADGNLVYANDETYRIIGMNPKDAKNYGWTANIHPADKDRILQDWALAVQSKKALNTKHRFVHANGNITHCSVTIAPVPIGKNSTRTFIGTAIDITSRVEIERKKEKQENIYRKALHHAQIGTWRLDPINRLLYCDKNNLEIIGYDHFAPDSPISVLEMTSLLPEEDKNRVAALFKNLEHVDHQYIEYRFFKNGATRWAATTIIVDREKLNDKPTILGITQDITEKKQQELKFKALAENAKVGIFETNTKGNLIFLNQQAADIVGVAKEDCLQNGFLIKHIHPDMQEQITTDWRQAIEHQQAYQNEIKWKRPDGRIAFTYLSISPLHSIDGDYRGQVGTLIDLTERKELARIVKLRKIRFQNALNSANIGTWRVDLEKSCIYCDQNMLNIMEITDHDPETPISNELLMPLILEEDRKNMGTTLQKAQKHIPYESLEWRFNINGQLKWMRSHGSIYRDPLDDKYYLIGITQDITKEKQQIARIAQSEARIRSIFEGSNAVISFVNPEGIVQYANQQLFGAPNESLEQRSILEWFPEREKADFRKVLKATLLDRKTYTFESSVLDKNGKPSFYLHSLSPVIQDAEVLGVAIISNDISSIKSLKSNFRKASFSIENASEIIIWTDKAGRITYSNNALTKFLGYTQEEVFNMHLLDFDQMRSPADWKVFWSLIKKRINNTVLVKLIAKDGRLLDFEATYEYVFYEGEEYAIIFARDISERIRMEAVRQQKNQLAHINKELSQFAYIASHDLQEPLRTIISFTQRIQQKYSDRLDEAGLTQMNFVVEASKRMNLLVKGILDYSRLGRNPKISEINTTALINTILKDLYQRIEETKATVHIEHLPNIRGYETELRLLFQNLISNGLKFQQKDKPPVIYIRANEQDSAWRFEIEDNGIGIAERHQKKIFEIFQRLHRRDTYEGTGIGLAQCKRIVDLHHGKIGVQSEVGKGSTFYFTISKNNNI